jgi:transcriptional regulator with XRE-family HTH domain
VEQKPRGAEPRSSGADWPARLAARVGQSIARVRKERKMTAQALAKACADLGLPIGRVVIANLERGHRETITVGELMALAAALDVPPVTLVFPVGEPGEVEYLPGRTADAWDAALWFSGDAKLTTDAAETGRAMAAADWRALRAAAPGDYLGIVLDRDLPLMDVARRIREIDGQLCGPTDGYLWESFIRDLRRSVADLRERGLNPPVLYSNVPGLDAEDSGDGAR